MPGTAHILYYQNHPTPSERRATDIGQNWQKKGWVWKGKKDKAWHKHCGGWEREETGDEDVAGQEGVGGPGRWYGWQREWSRSSRIPGWADLEPTATSASCGELDPVNSTTPANSQHAPGTWLGSVVHDPDESFGQ